MYWTMAQQLAHTTVSGTNIRAADLYASGTVSGPTRHSLGSLLEMSLNGAEPMALSGGTRRTFFSTETR
jgi:fumarylacetoacetase